MYEVTYEGEHLVAVEPRYPDVPERVEKRTVADLADWPYPKRQLVPLTEVVHDRLNVEVFRGCTRGCRFCQAGMITRPVRERPADQVRTMIDEGIRRTGYDEVALTSLSTADFSGIERVVADTVNDPTRANQVSVSLPSLRVDAFTVGIAAELQKARRTGLTFAPEAGTWRMRQVINKLIHEDDLYGAVDSAFSQGWRRMKLYFLTGLPTETDEDTLGIAELARHCVELGKKHNKSASVTVSVGGFVPKPFTPFQWFGQNTARGAPAQDLAAQGRRPPRRRACSSSGTTPRPPRSRASSAAATAGSARSSRTSGATAARSRSGREKFDFAAVARRHGAPRPVGRLVRPPAPQRGRGPAVGPPLGRPAQGLPLAGLARRARRARPRGLPLDPVLRLRRLHRLQHRAHRGVGHPAGRRQPGHRPGPRPRDRRGTPVTLGAKPVLLGQGSAS